MILPKVRELVEAVKALVRGPYTSKFPAAMPEIPDGFRGAPRYHEDDCMGCASCFNACPARAIDCKDDKNTRKRTLCINHDRCIFCGQCQLHCPTEKGVMLSKDWNLVAAQRVGALTEKIEHDLVICDCCGAIIAPKKQIIWIAERLDHLAYANPTVLLQMIQSRSLPSAKDAKTDKPVRRGDRIRVLCPVCRRETALVV